MVFQIALHIGFFTFSHTVVRNDGTKYSAQASRTSSLFENGITLPKIINYYATEFRRWRKWLLKKKQDKIWQKSITVRNYLIRLEGQFTIIFAEACVQRANLPAERGKLINSQNVWKRKKSETIKAYINTSYVTKI